MKKYTSILILFLIIISSNQYIFTDWVKMSSGINGGHVFTLTLIGNNVAAGTEAHGLYFSTNQGNNWIETSLFNISVFSMTVDDSTVFAGTNHGVYMSTNYGANWVQTSLNIMNGYSILKKDSYVFVGTDGGVYRSANLGQTWEPTTLMGFPIISLNKQDDKIFAGADYNYGIYVTTNNGTNWLQTGLENRDINNIYINGQEFFVCTDNGVYSSTNSGVNWSQIGMNSVDVYSFTKIGSVLLAGAQNGVYKSTNNGFSWYQIIIGSNIEVRSLITKNTEVFAGTKKGGVFKSVNSGDNWVQAPLGISEIVILCSGGTNLYAGTNMLGLFRSTDYGMNWFRIGFENNNMLAAVSNETTLFASPYYNTGIYRTTNNGANWLYVSNLPIFCFAIADSRIYAGAYWYGLFYSTNNGSNWLSTWLNFTDVYTLATYGTNVYAGTWGLGLYYSTNNGATWHNVLTNQLISTIFANTSGTFAGTENGLFYSSNNGANWSNIGLTDKVVLSVAAIGSNIFAGTDSDGVFLTTNYGESWIPVNDGFINNYRITSIKIFDNFIYTGTYGSGVWRRNISELIGINIISSEIPVNFSLSQNYPNPFNPVTKIKFSLPAVGQRHAFDVRLVIYDILGREITTLVNQRLNPGTYEVEWSATGGGSNNPSGVYFYKLVVTDASAPLSIIFSETRKMVLIK